jgi:hypothetical protein
VWFISALIKGRRERWASIFWSHVLNSGASLFLQPIGQCEAPKPKETDSIALPNQLQKPRDEI